METNAYAARKSHRLQFRFWLDVMRDEEFSLAEYIENLKQTRRFAQTIRDALRLVQDLRAGRVDVLLSLFPWITDHFQSPAIEVANKPVQDQLQRLEKLLLEGGAKPMLPASTGVVSRPSAAKSDDDLLGDLEIKQAKSDENPTFNMLISSVNLGMARLDELPAACIEYGVKRGKLAESAMKFVPKAPPKGPKAMDVPQFDAPEIDLDDLGF